MDKVRDINVDGVRTYFFHKNNNLSIAEFTKENDVKFKKFVKQELLYGVLIFVAAVVIVIGNYYSINYFSRISSLEYITLHSWKDVVELISSIIFSAINGALLIGSIPLLSGIPLKNLFVVSKISTLFSLLSKTGRDKAYAKLNKDEDLLFYTEGRYGAASLKALDANLDEFSDDELSQFVMSVKEQLRNHGRINKIKQVILKNEADTFILKDLKKKKQELEQRDEELSDSIGDFLNGIKAIEKDKARKKANEEAIGVLAA